MKEIGDLVILPVMKDEIASGVHVMHIDKKSSILTHDDSIGSSEPPTTSIEQREEEDTKAYNAVETLLVTQANIFVTHAQHWVNMMKYTNEVVSLLRRAIVIFKLMMLRGSDLVDTDIVMATCRLYVHMRYIQHFDLFCSPDFPFDVSSINIKRIETWIRDGSKDLCHADVSTDFDGWLMNDVQTSVVPFELIGLLRLGQKSGQKSVQRRISTTTHTQPRVLE